MTTKPTPGPWIVGGDLIVRAKNAQGYDRAFFSVHAGNTAPMEATTAEESHANARLIAAAPELYDALRELLTDMVIAQGNMRKAAKRDPAWEGCAEIIQPRVDAARAAIAKAEGK